MINERRLQWNHLKEACQRARLPQPQMSPGQLDNSFKVKIPGHVECTSRNLSNMIAVVQRWVLGQQAQMLEEDACNQPLDEAASLAKRVLDINGEGGPYDHELLAKAVLSLTVHLSEKESGNQENRD